MQQVFYMRNPSASDNTGAGLAELAVETLKKRFPGIISHGKYVGGAFDGAVVTVHFAEHVAEKLKKKSELIWIWDGAHMSKLSFRHTLKAFPEIQAQGWWLTVDTEEE